MIVNKSKWKDNHPHYHVNHLKMRIINSYVSLQYTLKHTATKSKKTSNPTTGDIITGSLENLQLDLVWIGSKIQYAKIKKETKVVSLILNLISQTVSAA